MPFPFTLPTTSVLVIQDHVRCDSHPSLILAVLTRRNVLRSVLKEHKASPDASKPSKLMGLLAAIEDYVPYLLALDAGLSGRLVSDEEIHVVLVKDFEVEWRPTLAPTVAGRPQRRARGKGLDYEICFVLTTLAYTHSLLARARLHSLYSPTTPNTDTRVAAIAAATRHLLQANSIHCFVSRKAAEAPSNATADVSVGCQSALAFLALAEATLLAILKDDPYPTVVIQGRNKDDREWMYKSPDIPKVRAHLFARLALQSAEYAEKASALLRGAVGEELVTYVQNVQRTSKAKACRFLGIDAELGGKAGEGIAWLNGGLRELGFKVEEGSSTKKTGLSKFKKSWQDRREDKKIEKSREWGLDAGRLDESRVLEMLSEKWNKSNDLVRQTERE